MPQMVGIRNCDDLYSFIRVMDNAAAVVESDTVLYRQCGRLDAAMRTGVPFVDHGYSSAATASEYSGAQSTSEDSVSRIKWRIKVPKGSTLINLNANHEIDFPRGTKFIPNGNSFIAETPKSPPCLRPQPKPTKIRSCNPSHIWTEEVKMSASGGKFATPGYFALYQYQYMNMANSEDKFDFCYTYFTGGGFALDGGFRVVSSQHNTARTSGIQMQKFYDRNLNETLDVLNCHPTAGSPAETRLRGQMHGIVASVINGRSGIVNHAARNKLIASGCNLSLEDKWVLALDALGKIQPNPPQKSFHPQTAEMMRTVIDNITSNRDRLPVSELVIPWPNSLDSSLPGEF